jgi:hypothetical protein
VSRWHLLSPTATFGRLSRTAVPAVVVVVVLLALALPARAEASQLVARNTSGERLAVSRDGKALLTYRSRGGLQRVLAWGAVNARGPDQARSQIRFDLDYSGGWGRFGRAVWKGFRNFCWHRSQANFGLPYWKPGHGARELRLSHWTGPIARLDVWLDWSYGGRWHHLFGRLTYRGRPVHGFATTPTGEPLDGYGRVLYLDTLDSAYGPGWRRENGFVARNPDGSFCYGFVPHRAPSGEQRPAGNGRRYRLSASGPGVTPDISWEGSGLHAYRHSDPGDRAREAQMNALQREISSRSKPCHA